MPPKKRKSRPSDDPYSLRQVEQPHRSDAATATLRHYSVDYVVQTPTANQVAQAGVGCASEPSREFGNQNRDCEINTSELSSVMGPFFERGDVCAWYRGTSAVLPVVTPGKLYSGAFVPDYNLRRTERDGYVLHTDSIPTVLGENTRSPVTRRNADVYTEQELQEMDANLAFIVPSESRMEILKEQAIELMLAASEPTLPCGICELSFCQSKITATCLTDEFISLMRQSLTLHPETTIPHKLKKQYDASGLDSRLKDVLLYPPAINTSGPYKTMNVCDSCRDHVESGTYTVPPACAIANGNYVGFLPRNFATMTRTDEQAIALVMPCASLSVVTGGSCKTIKSHHYVVRNTEGSIAEMLPRDLSSRVRVAMVGSMTSAQAAACKKRYHLNLPLCNQVLRFFKKHNREYQNGSEELIRPNLNSHHTIRTSVIIDRTSSTGTSTEDEEIVARVRDNSTYSAFGSVVEEGTERAIEESWIGASSVLSQPPPRNGFDVLVRKSNAYVPMSKWAVCVQMFPTLFPFGYGGPTELRQTRLSVRKWILRCLQVHGHRFETDYAFLLLAFDFLATQNARDTMCVKMNIKRQALKAASIRRSTVMEAIKYFNHMIACRQKGIKPRPPSLDVQRVIDLRKGLYVPESAYYGSNTGRMRARHDLLGMLKRFGPLQVFFYRITRFRGYLQHCNQDGKSFRICYCRC